MRTRTFFVSAMLLAVASSGCSPDATGPGVDEEQQQPAPMVYRLNTVAGSGVEAAPGATIPVRVMALDSLDRPIKGAIVTWESWDADASVSPRSSRTGADGIAAAGWVVGSRQVVYKLTASASRGAGWFTATSLSARVGPPRSLSLQITTGDVWTGQVGDTRQISWTMSGVDELFPSDTVVWRASDPLVATVSLLPYNGARIEARGTGRAWVHAIVAGVPRDSILVLVFATSGTPTSEWRFDRITIAAGANAFTLMRSGLKLVVAGQAVSGWAVHPAANSYGYSYQVYEGVMYPVWPAGPLTGTITGDSIDLSLDMGGIASWHFTGKITGTTMAGAASYTDAQRIWAGTFTATRTDP